MADLKSIAELRTASQDSLVEFLRTDLALCSTFVSLVTTELFIEDTEGAKQAFSKAERGYEHFVTRVQDTAQRQELEQNLALLRSRLDALKAPGGKGPF
jgi:hypothetical protein